MAETSNGAAGQVTYTYRAGERVALRKEPDQFVTRALPPDLAAAGMAGAEQVSPASSRVTTAPADLERRMSAARFIAPTHHAYREADSGQEFLITDRVLVTVKPGTTPAQVDALAGKYGLVLRNAYSDRDFLFQLTDHTGMNPVKLVVKLNEDEREVVEAAEHDLNYRMTRYQLQLPTDPRYASQWHLHRRMTPGPSFDVRSSSRCEEAWQLLDNLGSRAVVVCVTDDGCKLNHADFGSSGKFAGWGYLEGNTLRTHADIGSDPAKMYQTGSDHGTSCNGVVAADSDAKLTVGAAPGCRLLPIKWESDGNGLFISDGKLLTVLNFVADKVDVVSSSWGSTPTTRWSLPVLNKIAQLAQTGGRRGRGIVFLWAAGNENCPIQHTSTQNVPFTNGIRVTPAGTAEWIGVETSKRFVNNLVGVAGVMHVAALASTARRSHYSNYGTGIVLCAPTNNVHEYHRMNVAGLGIVTTTGAAGGVTTQFGGTSSATPLVAGIAALVISANPQLTAAEVISVLKRTASKDLDTTPYPRTPPASFDPDPTASWDISPVAPFDAGAFTSNGDADGTWSPWFGHGRVDAREAVAEAQRRAGGSPGSDPIARSFISEPRRSIPDNTPAGIRDVIVVPDTAVVQDVAVDIELEHTWVGDLRVSLTSPAGTTVVLHDRAGGSSDDIRTRFDAAVVPGLAGFKNQPLKGNWALQVQDLAAADVGILLRWGLRVTA